MLIAERKKFTKVVFDEVKMKILGDHKRGVIELFLLTKNSYSVNPKVSRVLIIEFLF